MLVCEIQVYYGMINEVGTNAGKIMHDSDIMGFKMRSRSYARQHKYLGDWTAPAQTTTSLRANAR